MISTSEFIVSFALCKVSSTSLKGKIGFDYSMYSVQTSKLSCYSLNFFTRITKSGSSLTYLNILTVNV
uniref:Uncharacterized protein n=1 Tax=Arundo donax TaxID=35708 RepID=A0A0A9A3Q1_ARUDO